MHHPCGFHSSELLIKPLERIDQFVVINAQLMAGPRPVGVGLSGRSGCRQLEKPSYYGSAHIRLLCVFA